VKVTDISAKTEQAINSTDDASKKQQLAADSETAKVAAVKEEGMEPQQYNNVIQLVKAELLAAEVSVLRARAETLVIVC
jgi:Domain of unknown function (DUF4168)